MKVFKVVIYYSGRGSDDAHVCTEYFGAECLACALDEAKRVYPHGRVISCAELGMLHLPSVGAVEV